MPIADVTLIGTAPHGAAGLARRLADALIEPWMRLEIEADAVLG